MLRNKLLDEVNKLSLDDFLELLHSYSDSHIIDFNDMKSQLVTEDNQNRLRLIGVNSCCPECGSVNIIAFGKKNGIQTFRCKDCGRRFTVFTGTFLEKSNFHWSVWVYVLDQVLNNQPLEVIAKNTQANFKLTSFNTKTAFLMKHKLLHAFTSLNQPVLSGVIQVDETSFRESQKGSRDLVSYVKNETREPRYGRHPSKYGVMGNEWATVCCMVDLNNRVVAKVIGLGKMDVDVFYEMFDEHISNPAYICSDGNRVYRDYARLKGYSLYVKPSNYVDEILKAGVKQLSGLSPTAAAKQSAENQRILRNLYNNHRIDYIYKHKNYSYKKFDAIKQQNSLSLARVNEFHKDLKRYIDKNMAGVSTEYLQDYISFYVYCRNWKVENGRIPSTREDAEKILIELLKQKVNYTVSDMRTQELNLPKTSGKYMQELIRKTEEAKKITGNEYFKYDSEDGVATFDMRMFLEDLPGYKLDKLRRHYRLPKQWIKRSIINELMQKPDINEQILLLIDSTKHTKISEEDRQAIASAVYKIPTP